MPIRNAVIFRHPAAFVGTDEWEGVVSTSGAAWFVALLGTLPLLEVDHDLCQEDWGVVVFAARRGFRFWFGLTSWDEEEWLVHVHHWGLFQRFRSAGRTEHAAVIADLHAALQHEDGVADAKWFHEPDLRHSGARGAASPDEA